MAELAFLPGPPILQVAGQKFLTRNEAMRSLLGHLGKESFHTFRGFKPPLVCPLVGKKKEAGCTRDMLQRQKNTKHLAAIAPTKRIDLKPRVLLR